MPSLSFDPVAHAYDATRRFPPGVDEQIARGIAGVAGATPQTRFLEVGIGTGRIALPLVSLGHVYTGVDISEKMVEQLEAKLRAGDWEEYEQPWGALPDENTAISHIVRRFRQPEKYASMRLVISDMTALPFYDHSFDVVIGVHVFHLVDGWEETATPREALESVTKRLWSSTWVVPDDIFTASVERLQRWADDYFGDTMDVPRKGERQFVICKTRVR